MESGHTYFERSDDNLAEACENAEAERVVSDNNRYRQKSAEVIVPGNLTERFKKKGRTEC